MMSSVCRALLHAVRPPLELCRPCHTCSPRSGRAASFSTHAASPPRTPAAALPLPTRLAPRALVVAWSSIREKAAQLAFWCACKSFFFIAVHAKVAVLLALCRLGAPCSDVGALARRQDSRRRPSYHVGSNSADGETSRRHELPRRCES